MLIADSAYPLSTYPTSWNGQAIGGYGFYIGGNTPHTWSAAEVAALKTHYRYLLPIYTCSNPASRNAATDAAAAIGALRALAVPGSVLVQLDYETAVDSAYEQAFGALLAAAGYILELYGSAATVAKNVRPAGGYDEASWTGKDTAPADTGVQFVDVGSYDLNDFRASAPLWDTRPPAPTPPTVRPATTQEDDMTQAIDGQADIGWSMGQMRVVQVTADGGAALNGGRLPVLRVTLHTRAGAVVLAGAGSNVPPWQPTETDPVLEFTAHQAPACGITLESVGAATRYAAIVAP